MAWLDLQADILADLGEVSLSWLQREELLDRERYIYQSERVRKRDYMRRTAPRRNAARQAARALRAAARPPCPHCGAPVDRVGRSATIPKYCSPKCMRAARWARWYRKAKTHRPMTEAA